MTPITINEPSIEPSGNQKEEVSKKSDSPKPKKPSFDFPDWLDQDLWDEFREHRKAMKQALTPLAEKKNIEKLVQLVESGHDPTEIINNTIANGWRGFFEPSKPKGEHNGNTTIKTEADLDRAFYASLGRSEGESLPSS